MLTVRRSDQRGAFDFGWLQTRHTFAFGHWRPGLEVPHRQGFRALRVINDDVVQPGQGFGEHPHESMEIITYILSGRLAHKDSTGSVRTIGPGDVQHMSAGSGIFHSEFNASDAEPVHLLQVWIRPARQGGTPGYAEAHFDEASRRNTLRVVASPDGRDGSLAIGQDAVVMAALLDAGREVRRDLGAGRGVWVHVARGSVGVNGERLSAGDGVGVTDEQLLTIRAEGDAEVLVFDLA